RAAAGALVAFAATLVALGGFFGAVSLIGNADGRAGLFNSLSASVNLQAALPSRFAPGASLSDEIVTIVVWAVIGLALVTLVRRWRGDARAAWPAAAWALIAWLSLSSSSVWTAHDVNPVTAGRSQVALAGAVARGWPGSGLIGFRPATPAAVISRLAFRAPSDRDPAIVLETGELPAGTYRLDVASAVPVSLTAHAGRAPQPPWRWPAAPGEPVTFTLATAVRRLTVLADPAAAGSPPSVTVRPLIARADSPIAEHVARYGGLLVYAHDAALTFEAGGFWLQRGRETAFTVADDRGRTPAVELDLEAGDELVAVRFTREGWSRDLALQPHERAIVEVLPADVVLPVTVEVSGSRAPLGVWIGLSSPR
ncbi:MAG: hypothetical protein AB1635_17855, partial [Acidobacteriota bacterium]